MSSSQRSESPARSRSGRGPIAGWSLRTRLLAALIGLLAVVCVIIGVATEVAAYQVQVKQLDDTLNKAAARAGQSGPGGPDAGHGGHGPRFLLDPGQAADTVGAEIVNGDVIAAPAILGLRDGSSADLYPQELPATQAAVVLRVPPDGRQHTRDLGPYGVYRLMAVAPTKDHRIVTGLPMRDVNATRDTLLRVDVGVSAAALLLAGLAGAAIIRTTLQPLRRVASTARRVTQLPLDRGDVALGVRVPEVDTDSRTEVGQVGAALNLMLRHVGAALSARQESETRVRHFVADASHELRTPLAAIRGYAELTRRYADAVPADVAHAMRRVESETARMSGLVDDLLLLARLDSGRPLANEPVDLSRLVVDAVSDAHAASPQHRWQLDLPADPVVVHGDPTRLHQVLANLLANARTHTPPGTTVVTSVALQPSSGSATVTVTDDGPGIPLELQPDVFDRFVRGDTSRSRSAGSTGLGLAIVAAVVEAHQGTVGVRSRPGETSFVVSLPLDNELPVPGQAVPAASGVEAELRALPGAR